MFQIKEAVLIFPYARRKWERTFLSDKKNQSEEQMAVKIEIKYLCGYRHLKLCFLKYDFEWIQIYHLGQLLKYQERADGTFLLYHHGYEGEAGFDPLFYAEKQRNERPELIVFRPWYQVFDNGREVPVFSV